MPRESQPDDRERFEHMLKAARDAIGYSKNRSRKDLDIDSMFLRAIVNCVQEIGEAAARTTDSARAKAPSVPWPKIVGMRHILVHAYYSIDSDALWKVVREHLPALITELEPAIAAWPAQE